MPQEINLINLDEFQQLGFLQEANRLFFHPCGLALTLIVDDVSNTSRLAVIDARSDPEGYAFENPSKEHALNVDSERRKRYQARYELFADKYHKDPPYSACVECPENYAAGKMTKLQFCNPPDVQPLQPLSK